MSDVDKLSEPEWGEEKYLFSFQNRTLLFILSCLIFFGFFLYNLFLSDGYIDEVGLLFGLVILVIIFYILIPMVKNPRMSKYYWNQFKKNKIAVASLIFLMLIFSIGVTSWLFVEPPDVRPEKAYQPPVGFSVPNYVPVNCVGVVENNYCHGTWSHPLGTTGDGKDILTLIILGMRVSMEVGLISTLISVLIATIVGTSAAYFGGYIDEILMRYVDIQLTFPTFFLYLLLVYLFGQSLLLLIVIFGVTSWGGIARIIRSEALQRKEEFFVKAAEGTGASDIYIIRRHIIPNVSNSIVTAATLNIPIFILSEAALSFIGLSDPNIPSWGQVIASGRGDLSTAWWISTIPGIFLFLTILAFNFIGDSLRDALDPKHKI